MHFFADFCAASQAILERYARAQFRPFRGGLAELSIFSGAEERPPLTAEESPPFQGGVLQYVGQEAAREDAEKGAKRGS